MNNVMKMKKNVSYFNFLLIEALHTYKMFFSKARMVSGFRDSTAA